MVQSGTARAGVDCMSTMLCAEGMMESYDVRFNFGQLGIIVWKEKWL